MMNSTRRNHSSFFWKVVAHCIAFTCLLALVTAEPLSFLNRPPLFLHGYLGQNLVINCSTNDENASVSLHYRPNVFTAFRERKPQEKMLFKTGQVFSLQSLVVSDGGNYACVAKGQDNETIRWPKSRGMLLLSPVKLPTFFKLRPGRPITVLEGEEARVKCEAEGATITKLQWKKQSDSGIMPVPENVVTIVKDTSKNRVRAVLKITNAQKEDSGLYKCLLSVFGKTDSKLTKITVKEPLVFLNRPQVIVQGHMGQNAAINCSTNDKDAKVSLLHRPNPFVPFKERKPTAYKLLKKKQVFWILNINVRDAGIYACEATDVANQTIRWPRYTGYFVLSQATIPDYFVVRPRRPIIVQQGQQAEVNCESEGVETTQLQWKKKTKSEDAPVPNNMVTLVKDKATNRVRAILTIPNAQKKDGGFYKCVVTVGGKTAYKRTKISVKESLAFLNRPPLILQGYLRQNLVINCSTSDDNATVSLLYRPKKSSNFTERKPDVKKLLKKGQVFTLLNLIISDAGFYACEAKTQNHFIRWPHGTGFLILAKVELPKHFILKPGGPIFVHEGQKAKVKCESEGVTTTKLQWKVQTNSGDVAVPDHMVTVVKNRSTNRVRAVLKISNAQKKDDGWYKCVQEVPFFDKADFKLIRIQVKEQLAFLNRQPVILNGYLGLNLVINCSTNDKDASVSLLHSAPPSFGSPTERKPAANKVLKTGQVFTILNLQIRDAGRYTCVATNKAKQTIQWSRSAGFYILSRAVLPGYFVLKPKKPIRVQQGQEADVECEAEGVKATNLQWRKQTGLGDVPIPNSMVNIVKDRSTNRVRAILKISNAQKKDSGSYKCVLTFYGKTIHKLTRVIMRETT